MTIPRLLPRHIEDLQLSGLSDKTITQAGFFSVQRSAPVLGWEAGPGLAIPYPGTDNGRGEPYCRVRLDKPGSDGKRYRFPRGSANRIYIPRDVEDKLKAFRRYEMGSIYKRGNFSVKKPKWAILEVQR